MAAPLDPLAEAFRWAHVAVAVLEATLGQVALQATRDHPPALERFSFYSAWLELAATRHKSDRMQRPTRTPQASFLAQAKRMSSHCAGFLTAERAIGFIAAAVAKRPDLTFQVVLRAAAGCVRPEPRKQPLTAEH